MYEFPSRVRYSAADKDGFLTLQGILDYFQDCSTFQSEDLGIGIEYLKKQDMVWVLSFWQIAVRRYPKIGEYIVVGTAPYDFKGFLGYRNFLLRTKEGEELACANSIWTLMHISKMRPVKANQAMKDAYVLEDRYPMDYADRKILLPENSREGAPIVVKQHHLDTNSHVNNGQYVRMALDLVPEGPRVKQLRAEYKKSAVLNDVIYPHIGESGQGEVISLCDEKGNPYAVISLEG